MREIPSYENLKSLEEGWKEWAVTNLAAYNLHAKKVSSPMPREAIRLRDTMIDTTDALTWSRDLIAEASDYETQALAIATENLTVAQAQGVCHRFIRCHKALKTLADSADRKLSCLQSLNRGG